MASFNIEEWHDRFVGNVKTTTIRRPKEIACFSYDESRQLFLDDRSMRYYYPPRIGSALSQGFDTFQQLDDSTDDHLESLLKTIVDLEQRTGRRCQADFITWRGMMAKIMASLYDEHRTGFEMNATKFQGTIFIEENHDYKMRSKEEQNGRQPYRGQASQELMSYWGYKFETLSLLPQPWDETSRAFIEARETAIVNNHAQYCSVVKTVIGKNTKLILGGEVDAIWDCKPADFSEPINWVELKTHKEVISEFDELKYERKLLKFWIQSFLLGVPKIIVGFRNQGGILKKLEELETRKIPDMVKSGKRSWEGNMVITFTQHFLDILKATITEGGVWQIRRQHNRPYIEIFQLESSGFGEILSDDFVDWRLSEQANGKEESTHINGQVNGEATNGA